MEVHLQSTESYPVGTAEGIVVTIIQKQVWVMACPRCKANMEKEHAADEWKCPACGWE